MKRVLHISETFDGGGAEAVFRETLNASESCGFENSFFVSPGNISVFSYIYSFKNHIKLASHLDKFKPNVIHIHNYYHYLTPSILMAIKNFKKKNNCRVFFTAHDYHLICPNSGMQYFKQKKVFLFSCSRNNISFFKRFDYRSWLHSSLKVCQFILGYKILKLHNVIDTIVSPSEFLKQTFISYGIKNTIKVIRNPTSLSPTSLEKDNVENDYINIVFIGRLSTEKGIINFIDTLNTKTDRKVNFHIYGKGELEDVLQKKVKTSRDDLNIILHGYVDSAEIPLIISKFDIFVLPSMWYENAPLSIIEAANAGLPILVPNRGGLAEMAQFTKQYAFLDSEGINLDDTIVHLYQFRGQNKIINPDVFSHERYRKNIQELYSLS